MSEERMTERLADYGLRDTPANREAVEVREEQIRKAADIARGEELAREHGWK